MLSPALLRLCCLAVMAPALTKAVRQADDFSYMPMSHKNNGDLLRSRIALPYANDRNGNQPGELHGISNGRGLNNGTLMSNGKLWHEETYNGDKLLKKISKIVSDEYKDIPLVQKPPNNVNGHISPSVGVSTPTFKNCGLNSTMNEASSDNQERMGLLNTNTSLDCDFQSKNSECQFSSPMCPEELSSLESEPLQDIPGKCATASLLSPPGSPKSASGESTSTVTAHNPPVVTFAELEEVKSSHEKCTSRAKDLLHRLRKLQILQVDKHVTAQIKYLFSHYQNALSIPCQKQVKINSVRRSKDPVDLKAEFLQSEDVRNLSTAALVSLVRKLESNTAGTLSTNLSSVAHLEESLSNEKVDVKLNTRDCSKIKQVTGSLLMRVKHLESAVDSDATDSSSGGESCDEYDGYDDKKTNTTTIQKRALWTWVFDRAPIAKRWTWLQSQVQDLEYRVRQIADLLAQARSAKGLACFEDASVDISLITQDSSATVKKVLKSVNGYVDHVPLVTNNGFHNIPNVPPSLSDLCLDAREKLPVTVSAEECSAVSRTRQFKSDVFRKRKLLYTAGLHYVSRKAARLSTVKCGCNSRCDVLPCILCCGRYNNTQSVDPSVMPLLERVALLEPTYHPVLSFEKDVPLSLHFENHLKKNETYYKVAKALPFTIKKTHLGIKPRGVLDHARHHSRRLTRHAAQTLLTSAKYRSNRSSKFHKRNLALARWKELQKGSFKNKHLRRWSAVSSCNSSRQGSPVYSPSAFDDGMILGSLSSRDHYVLRRRLEGHQYDIDNVVTPYSVKTYIPKLRYKDVVIPKWRFHDESLDPIAEDEMDEEDSSDETVIKRHEKLEIAERKIVRGSSSILNSARRARRSYRHDSRADSSGANTPDHLSMFNQHIMFQDSNSFISAEPASPALSPPATPGSVNTISDDSQPSCSYAPVTERRRTVSLTKKDKLVIVPAEEVAVQPEEGIVHQPYDIRTFPLSDDVWQVMQQELAATEAAVNEQSEQEDMTVVESSSPESPNTSSSTSSALEEDDDDIADPEWTVVRKHNSHDRTLVIKLAKR